MPQFKLPSISCFDNTFTLHPNSASNFFSRISLYFCRQVSPVAQINSFNVDPASAEAPTTADTRLAKATKAPKEKKAVTKKPSQNPTYLEVPDPMIHEAIASLKERTGSSQYAISKFVEDEQKAHLPINFKMLLIIKLRKLTASGKHTKVKNFYKIPAKPVPVEMKTVMSVKPKSTVVKLNKSTAVKPNKVTVKPKPKASAERPKSKSAVAKPKTSTRSKSITPKSKASGGHAMAAMTSFNITPSAKLKKAAAVAAKKPKIMNRVPDVKKAKK